MYYHLTILTQGSHDASTGKGNCTGLYSGNFKDELRLYAWTRAYVGWSDIFVSLGGTSTLHGIV